MQYSYDLKTWQNLKPICEDLFLNSNCMHFSLSVCKNKTTWKNQLKQIKKAPGVYCIVRPQVYSCQYNPNARQHKKLKYLAKKPFNSRWGETNQSVVLYIGKAEGKDGLYQRIGDYMRTLFGRSTKHRGGAIIRQLLNLFDLECYYFYTPNAGQLEKLMLDNFRDYFGTYPFANWRA